MDRPSFSFKRIIAMMLALGVVVMPMLAGISADETDTPGDPATSEISLPKSTEEESSRNSEQSEESDPESSQTESSEESSKDEYIPVTGIEMKSWDYTFFGPCQLKAKVIPENATEGEARVELETVNGKLPIIFIIRVVAPEDYKGEDWFNYQ